MKTKLKKQGWVEHPTYIQIDLHQPFWAAGKKYSWEGEGFGVSAEAIKYAQSINKNIRIKVFKYDTWEISPAEVFKLAHQYNSVFVTNSGVSLIIIPRINCRKIKEIKSVVQQPVAERRKPEQFKIV